MGKHDHIPTRSFDHFTATPHNMSGIEEVYDSHEYRVFNLARVLNIGRKATQEAPVVEPDELSAAEAADNVLELVDTDIEPIVSPLRKYRINTYDPNTTPLDEYEAAKELSQRHKFESYRAAGYVKETAADPDDPERMHEDLDKIDEDGVRVVVKTAEAIDSEAGEELGEGSVRVETSSNGDLTKLAAFNYLVEAQISDEEKQELEDLAASDSEKVRVIGALSMTDKALKYDIAHREELGVSYELIRDMVQEAMRSNTKEKWIITFADPAYQALVRSFGDKVLPVVGNKDKVITADGGNEHSMGVQLVPVIVDPCELPNNIAGKIRELEEMESSTLSIRVATLDPTKPTNIGKAIGRLKKTLIHVIDGLEDEYISQEVRDCLHLGDVQQVS